MVINSVSNDHLNRASRWTIQLTFLFLSKHFSW